MNGPTPSMRCLVSGASGHLGSYLVRRLVEAGMEVYALVRPRSDLWRLEDVLPAVHLLRSDLADISAAAPSIMEAAPEVVFHLAWEGVAGGRLDAPEQITRNVPGSLELWKIAHAAGCKHWIGVGSQAEYGPYGGVLDENTPTRPVTSYGVAKLAVGMLTGRLCRTAGMRSIWLRLLSTYGPRDDARHMIPMVIGGLLRKERPALTRGEQVWDYLYVEDAAEAIYQAAMTPGAEGIYNLGSGQARPVRAVVQYIRDLIDPALPLGFSEVPYDPNQIMRLETKIDRLRDATGWSPRVPLEQGLIRTVAWYKEHLSEGAGVAAARYGS